LAAVQGDVKRLDAARWRARHRIHRADAIAIDDLDPAADQAGIVLKPEIAEAVRPDSAMIGGALAGIAVAQRIIRTRAVFVILLCRLILLQLLLILLFLLIVLRLVGGVLRVRGGGLGIVGRDLIGLLLLLRGLIVGGGVVGLHLGVQVLGLRVLGRCRMGGGHAIGIHPLAA